MLPDWAPDRTGDCARGIGMAPASPNIRRPRRADKHSSAATKASCSYRDANKHPSLDIVATACPQCTGLNRRLTRGEPT